MIDVSDLVSRLEIISAYCRPLDKALFVILSTSVESHFSSYFGGVRTSEYFVSLSLVNISQSELEVLGSVISLYCDYVVVDTEKKHPFDFSENPFNESAPCLYSNLLSAAHDIFPTHKIIPWSPSRLTSESAINTVRLAHDNDLSGLQATVIGPGSIGFKIALGLVEEGVTTHMFSRNISRSASLVSAINAVKSPYTIASAVQATSLDAAFATSTCMILSASSRGYVNSRHLMCLPNKSTYILDVGKASLDSEAKNLLIKLRRITYQRLDISRELHILLSSYLDLRKASSCTYGPKCGPHPYLAGVRIISGGFPGMPTDIIVDDAESPVFMLGYIDSIGGYIPKFGRIE